MEPISSQDTKPNKNHLNSKITPIYTFFKFYLAVAGGVVGAYDAALLAVTVRVGDAAGAARHGGAGRPVEARRARLDSPAAGVVEMNTSGHHVTL